MSVILALDTSTDACSVALLHDGVCTSLFEIASKSHTQRLLPMIDDLLQQTDIRISDVDAIAFGAGPGSFTGLRICAGVVQGLAFGAQKPVIPVSTLKAMAFSVFDNDASLSLPVIASLDARMNEVYWGVYRSNHGVIDCVSADAVSPFIDVAAYVDTHRLNAEFHAVGQGWHYPEMQAINAAHIDMSIVPTAEAIVMLAAHEYDKGLTKPAYDAQPTYLRDSVSWQKRQRIRNDAS
jgi:tRNA threonylcarbamoyladenosine biosynthesis protein TsaB